MIISDLKDEDLRDLTSLIKETRIQIQNIILSRPNSKTLVDTLIEYSKLKNLSIIIKDVEEIESLKRSTSLTTLKIEMHD